VERGCATCLHPRGEEFRRIPRTSAAYTPVKQPATASASSGRQLQSPSQAVSADRARDRRTKISEPRTRERGTRFRARASNLAVDCGVGVIADFASAVHPCTLHACLAVSRGADARGPGLVSVRRRLPLAYLMSPRGLFLTRRPECELKILGGL